MVIELLSIVFIFFIILFFIENFKINNYLKYNKVQIKNNVVKLEDYTKKKRNEK